MMIRAEKKGSVVSQQARASIAYTICSVLQRAISFITMPIFSNLLSPEEYGLSTVYNSTFALLIIFTTLQLPYGSFSKAMIKFEKDRSGYVSAINGLVTVTSLIFFVLYFPFRRILNNIFDLPTFLISVMCLEMLMTTSINLWMGQERFEYKYKSVVVLTLAMSVVTTVCGILAVKYSADKSLAKVLANSVVVVFVGTIVYLYSIFKGKKFYDKTYWTYALKFNIPLLPYYLSQMVFNQSDKLMIDRICGRGDAAKYGVAYSIALIFTFVLNAINNSYTPWLYRKIRDADFKDNRSISLGIAYFMAFILLGIIAVAPEIMNILHPDYYDALWVIPPVAMSLLFLFYAQLYINLELYFETQRFLFLGSIFSAVVNIAFNAVLIPRFGYQAAGYTTLISYVLFAYFNAFLAHKLLRERGITEQVYNSKKLLFLAVGFMLAGFGLTLLYNFTIIRYAVIASIAILCLLNYKKIFSETVRYLKIFK